MAHPTPPDIHQLTRPIGEAWEEAGITGRITRELGEIPDPRLTKSTTTTTTDSTPTTTSPSSSSSSPPAISPPPQAKALKNKSLYIFFEVTVDHEETVWPEMHKRSRKWMTYGEAKHCFEKMKRPELMEALERCSVLR